MNKKRAFLFYPQDFLIGTQFLSNEQVGKYMKLLCYNFEVGHLTKEQIEHITGDLDPDVIKKFKVDLKGHYYHTRIESSRLKADETSMTMKFTVKEKYSDIQYASGLLRNYALAKEMHPNKDQIEGFEKLFKDKKFKPETVFRVGHESIKIWKQHQGSDKFNYKYLYGIFKGELNQLYAKHQETQAVIKKQQEAKEIEVGRGTLDIAGWGKKEKKPGKDVGNMFQSLKDILKPMDEGENEQETKE